MASALFYLDPVDVRFVQRLLDGITQPVGVVTAAGVALYYDADFPVVRLVG